VEVSWMFGFLATFLGVSIGGIVARLISGFSKGFGTIYAVCAGLILSLLSFDIAPEAIQNGDWFALLVGFIAGILLFKGIHFVFHFAPSKTSKAGIKTGLFLTIILSLHNLPMGAVIGTEQHASASSSLMHTLFLHSIPEGMILFTPLFLSGMKAKFLVVLSFLVAFPVALGAIIGELMDLQGHSIWVFLLSMSIGSVYMVTIKEILPEAVKYTSNNYSVFIATISFVVFGVFILLL
jgi:ZIP family zinc transporter